MLLLRDFLDAPFAGGANPAVSTVLFSMLSVSVDGMCAIDLRESGRETFDFELSRLAMACLTSLS